MIPTCSFFLLLLVSILSIVGARIHNPSSSSSTSELSEGQKFIKGLNLSPKLSINIVENNTAAVTTGQRIVEKQFKFPGLIDSAVDSNGETIEDFGHHAGYYSLPHSKGARMFYYFFESRNKSSSVPVVIWLTGGPGCSGSLALFYENGPFQLTNDLSLVWNEYGWDKESNLIYVDQPTGTGFSYSTNSEDIHATSEEAGVDFYDFLQEFFKMHPQYANSDFYITGESYAGHYIPAFAAKVNQGNKDKQGIPINLKGIAIGNGMTNPAIQYRAYSDYALDIKLINKAQYDDLSPFVSTCEAEIQSCGTPNGASVCYQAYSDCNALFNSILNNAVGLNYYDVRKKCEGSLCYDFSKAEKFLNQASVKNALGVGNIEFVSCSDGVYDAMKGEWVKNFEVGLPALLQDGIKILIYAGEYDLICNWLGNSRWVEAMPWSGQSEYVSAPMSPFTVDGLEAGLQKNSGLLTFLKVHNAGHLVPMDQPKASLEMLRRWMQDSLL